MREKIDPQTWGGSVRGENSQAVGSDVEEGENPQWWCGQEKCPHASARGEIGRRI